MFVFILQYLGIASFVRMEEVKVIQNKLYDPNPPKVLLNPENFMFAIGINQPKNDFITRPYFNITAIQGIYQVQGQTKIRTDINIQLEPCTKNHWEIIKRADYSKLIKPFGFDFLCPSLDQQIYLEGMYGSISFSFVEINITPCKTPHNPSLKWNPICAPEEEVVEYTQKIGYQGMNLIHSNFVVNADQSENYFTPYINDKLYFTFVPYEMTNLCDIYFQEVNVQNDKSLLPFTDYEYESFLTQQNNDIRETYQLNRKDGVHVTLTLRLSPYNITYNRSYKKTLQLLSELGGFLQIVFTCVGLIITRYNNFRFTIDLANNLYQFDQQQKQSKQLQKRQSQTFETQQKSEKQQTYLSSQSPEENIFKNNQNFSIQNMSLTHNQSILPLKQSNFKLSPESPQQNNNKCGQSVTNKSLRLKLQNTMEEAQIKDIIGNQQKEIQENDQQKQNKFIKKLKNVAQIIKDKYNGSISQNNKLKINEAQKQIIDFKQFLIQQFNKILSQETKLKIGFKYFLQRLTFNKCFNSEHNEYINKATELIYNDLDICNLLQKVQQIDKLKNIIFTKEQKVLFDFYQKPKIDIEDFTSNNSIIGLNQFQRNSINKLKAECIQNVSKKINKKKNKGILSQQEMYDNIEQYKTLFNSYITISPTLQEDSVNQKINKRLIKSLGDNILSIFKQSQYQPACDEFLFQQNTNQENYSIPPIFRKFTIKGFSTDHFAFQQSLIETRSIPTKKMQNEEEDKNFSQNNEKLQQEQYQINDLYIDNQNDLQCQANNKQNQIELGEQTSNRNSQVLDKENDQYSNEQEIQIPDEQDNPGQKEDNIQSYQIKSSQICYNQILKKA